MDYSLACNSDSVERNCTVHFSMVIRDIWSCFWVYEIGYRYNSHLLVHFFRGLSWPILAVTTDMKVFCLWLKEKESFYPHRLRTRWPGLYHPWIQAAPGRTVPVVMTSTFFGRMKLGHFLFWVLDESVLLSRCRRIHGETLEPEGTLDPPSF